MAIDKVKEYFKPLHMEDHILEFDVSSATVELAAEALHCEEKRIAKLTENINAFIEKMDNSHKTAIEKGRIALENKQKTLVDFWMTQYKLTNEYKRQALEMLGQLDVARYSSEMQISASSFFNDMGKMAKELSKVFGYTSINKITKDMDKRNIKVSIAKEKTNEMIGETTERFREIQESFADSNQSVEGIEISDSEKNEILAEFQTKKKEDGISDLLKGLM
ncbi:MAG: hypothetical protein BHW12_06390 [Coprobacillus sp. 28_7]|nr:MAG: hypothetical protein BHW12_06390 [Coprobacillus sp. 28_7]